MPTRKHKPTMKDRLLKAERKGYESGFAQGRISTERIHAVTLDETKRQMRAELIRDAGIDRFKAVTEIMIKLASQVGQSLQVLDDLDGRLDR